FIYCTSPLRLSEHGAYNRIECARAARRFPCVLNLLACGSLNLSTLRLLAPHLTAENHVAVLGEASGKSKREVELIAVRIAPRPGVPATIRRLAAVVAPAVELPAPPPLPTPRAVLQPVSAERYRIQFTVSRETHDLLRQALRLLVAQVRKS